MKLSVVIIARNAENIIEHAIKSVDFADEIIVIDNSSSDKTLEIAKKNKALVFSCKTDSFSQLRNYGHEKAKGEWILYIDSDERITDELKKEIISVIKLDLDIVAYKIKRKNFYLGVHEWPYVETMMRLFLNSKLKKWTGILHESPVVDGNVGVLNNFLLHYTHQNLSSMLTKTIEWSNYEAKLRFEANHPKMSWWRFPRVMLSAFLNSYIKQGGWRIGTVGLIESIYQAFSMFITYAKLWELQDKNE